MKSIFASTLRTWIPLAFAVACMCGLIYLAVQQSYRQSANDPQIELAEDAAQEIEQGAAAQAVVPATTRVDIAQSMAPFVVVYNETGTPILGSGILGGTLPLLPAGVFDYARTAGENRFTWQPEPTIRDALVLVHVNTANGGFVMAGRSLREVEIRETNLGFAVFAAALFTLIGTLALAVLAAWHRNK